MTFTRRILTLMLTMTLLLGSLVVNASAAGTTAAGIGFVTSDILRLRADASTGSAVLDVAGKNECVVILSKSGQWYKVNYNLREGYMHASYLSVSARENAELGIGRVNGSAVNLRTGPSTAHSVAAVCPKNATCNILGINDGWYKVTYQNITGYIRSDFVDLTQIPYENADSPNSPKYYRLGKAISGESSTAGASSVPVSGSQILAEARKYLGTRYLSGGASPAGFDCSGLVYYVLNQLGVSAYRTPVSQYQQGTAVEKRDLQPGDIVFFAGTGASGISHVGIYAGGGQFIHAPNSRSTVSYSDLTSGYWADHYYGARRIG